VTLNAKGAKVKPGSYLAMYESGRVTERLSDETETFVLGR
jgi:hypothetical protein